MKLFVSFVLLFALILCSSFQGSISDAGETINWQASSKLTWKDFKKSLPSGGIEAASTVCGIYISSNPNQVNDSTILVDVHAFFSRTLSAKTSNRALLKNEVLQHEQGHFDLTEVYSRKLRKDLSETRYRSIPAFFKSAHILYNKENTAFIAEQKEYDNETNHSINIAQQQKWTESIADMLDKYSAYSNTQLRVVIR